MLCVLSRLIKRIWMNEWVTLFLTSSFSVFARTYRLQTDIHTRADTAIHNTSVANMAAAQTVNTRLPHDLNTRDSVYVVKHDHFRSRDKDGSHTIRSDISENPTLQTWRLYVQWNRSYYPLKFYIAGGGNLSPFCSCDLDLDPMTFMTSIPWRCTRRSK